MGQNGRKCGAAVNSRFIELLGLAIGIIVCSLLIIVFYVPADIACVANVVSSEDIEDVDIETESISTVGTGVLLRPYVGQITSRFGPRWGRRHTGTDMCGDVGDPIKAADNGVVITAEYQANGYGNIIIVDHQNGVHTWYAHLDGFSVAEGDVVQKGDEIGKLGNTGKSTGPHLHFEVRKNGNPVDPSEYIAEFG